MGAFIDLSGQKFGRWTVVERVANNKWNQAVWRCVCECGTVRDINGRLLRDGSSKSCGCHLREKVGKHILGRKSVHGGSADGKCERLYRVWCGMKQRCYNQNNKGYKNYGGRGIYVCSEWKNDYAAFREWAYENGYDDNLPRKYQSLDRIDNDGPYSPENCAWHTAMQQCNNRRSSCILEFDGEKRTLAEWSRLVGFSKGAVWRRLNTYGYTVEQALTVPLCSSNCRPRKPTYTSRMIKYNGEEHTLAEWSRILHIRSGTLAKRIDMYGFTIEDAFTRPVRIYNKKNTQQSA